MVLTKKEVVLSEIFELSLKNEIDEEQAVEAESRIDGYLSGKIKTKSMEDIFKNINGDTLYKTSQLILSDLIN